MVGGVLATVDDQSRLLLRSVRHDVPWLKNRAEAKCVIDVVQRGLVRVWPLDAWAAEEGVSEGEAEEGLREAEPEPHEVGSKTSGQFFAVAVRKAVGKKKTPPGRPLHQIKLPDGAIFALFDQSTGPMTVRKGGGTDSGKILLVVCEKFLELIGQTLL